MKTITIAVADDIYQRASQKAAAAETSLLQRRPESSLRMDASGEPRSCQGGRTEESTHSRRSF